MKESKNKRIKEAYRKWSLSNYSSIYDAYENPSEKKEEAWDECKSLCKKYEGEDLRVIGKNIYYFSAGFIGIVDGKKAFVFITAYSNEYMILEDK